MHASIWQNNRISWRWWRWWAMAQCLWLWLRLKLWWRMQSSPQSPIRAVCAYTNGYNVSDHIALTFIDDYFSLWDLFYDLRAIFFSFRVLSLDGQQLLPHRFENTITKNFDLLILLFSKWHFVRLTNQCGLSRRTQRKPNQTKCKHNLDHQKRFRLRDCVWITFSMRSCVRASVRVWVCLWYNLNSVCLNFDRCRCRCCCCWCDHFIKLLESGATSLWFLSPSYLIRWILHNFQPRGIGVIQKFTYLRLLGGFKQISSRNHD